MRSFQSSFSRSANLAVLIFFLGGCVTHIENVGDDEKDLPQTVLNGGQPIALPQLKNKMKSCAVTFAMAADAKDRRIDYVAQDALVTYQSADRDLLDFMQMCAGTHYDGKGRDSGNLIISGVNK
nr:hypothetical protein [uncultured Enterobacter sp.]